MVLVEEPEDAVEVKAEGAELAENDMGEDEEAGDVAPIETIAGMYIVSIVGRSKTKILHRIGECYRQPGLYYASFEVLGEEIPSTSAYHKACKQCFRKGIAEASNALEEETSGEVSSSEMTSTGPESTG